MYNTLRTILMVLFVQSFCLAQGGKGTIKGRVFASDSLPAGYVPVGIKGTTLGTTTDSEGNYKFKAPEGNHMLLIQFVGHEPEEKQVEVKAGETTEVEEFRLKENSKELQEVVVVGNPNKYTNNDASSSLRLVQPLIEVPQNIQIVTSDALKEQQIISMSDGLVRNVSGATRAEHWGDLYTNIVSRGSQVQAFRNGFNVVNSYWGPLTSFMLASGDPSGLYNVVTKKPTGKTKGEAAFTLGSYGLYRSTLDLDGKLSKDGKLLYRLNLAAQNKNSFRANEYNNRYVIAPVVSYQLDDKTKLTFEYTYQHADMSNVGSFYVFSTEGFKSLPRDFTALPAGSPGTKINDHSTFLNLQHNFNKNWKLTSQLSYFLYDQIGTSMWPTNIDSSGKIIRNIGLWDARSKMYMGQVFLNGDVTTGPIRHRILAGLDVSRKSYLADWSAGHNLDSANAPFDPKKPYLGTPVTGYPTFDRSKPLEERAYSSGSFQDQAYTSAYLQDELGFLENKLRLTLAGRYTYMTQAYYGADTASHFTPRVALSGSINKDLTVYAMYDQAFIPQSGRLSNGGKVKPITGNNMEIGVKKNWFEGKWNTTFAIYRIVKNNELTADPTKAPASGLSIVFGQKTVDGVEFDLKGTIFKGFDVIANYAYTYSRVTKVVDGVTAYKVGDIVPGFSSHTINTWLNYKMQSGVLKNTGISAGTTALIDRATYWERTPDRSKEIGDYFKLDGGLFWDNGKIRIAGNVYNLLDEYLYSGSYASYFSAPVYSWQSEAPRNYRLTVNYKF